MNKWIDLHALWQIVALGLICGAGLPAVFAIGVVALAKPGPDARTADDNYQVVGGSVVGIAIAGLCFAVVAAAIGWGIYFIVEAR